MTPLDWFRSLAAVLAGACILGCDRPGAETAAEASESAGVQVAVPIDAGIDWQAGVTGDGTWMVSWRPTVPIPPVSEPFSVEVRIAATDGSPTGGDVEILFDAEMPHHGHGMNVIPRVTRRGEDWLVEGILMHMPGRWELSIDVICEDETERSQWTVQLER